MKKLIIALLLAVPFGLHAQTDGFDKLLKKYETKQGIMAVNLDGNILDGIIYFVNMFDSSSDDHSYEYIYDGEDYDCSEPDEEEVVCVEISGDDEDDNEDCAVVEAVAYSDDEDENGDYDTYDVYEYVYGEEGDYDYDYDDDDYDYDFDYSSYYNPYSNWSNYIGMFKTYLDGVKYIKAIVYENPTKKFGKEVQKQIVSAKPYKCVISMQDGDDDIRLYIIDNEAEGTCEMLGIVKEGGKYIVTSVLGDRDFKGIIDALKSFM